MYVHAYECICETRQFAHTRGQIGSVVTVHLLFCYRPWKDTSCFHRTALLYRNVVRCVRFERCTNDPGNILYLATSKVAKVATV